MNVSVPVSPALDLQAALVAAAQADAALTAQIGQRFYDKVPEDAVFPYVNFGEEQVIADLADCIEGQEIFIDLHIWARPAGSPGRVIVKRIAQSLKNVFHEAELNLAGSRLVLLEWQQLRVMQDPDGITQHGISTFRALTEEL